MSKPLYKSLAAIGAGALMFTHDQFGWEWPYEVVLAVALFGVLCLSVAVWGWTNAALEFLNRSLQRKPHVHFRLYINTAIITATILAVFVVFFYSTPYPLGGDGKKARFANILSLESALALRLGVPNAVSWGVPENGLYPLTWTVEAFGKYTANGVLIKIKPSSEIRDISVIAATMPMGSRIVKLPSEKGAERIYLRQPHGRYKFRLLAEKPTSITISYKFDGEPEISSVTWQAP